MQCLVGRRLDDESRDEAIVDTRDAFALGVTCFEAVAGIVCMGMIRPGAASKTNAFEAAWGAGKEAEFDDIDLCRGGGTGGQHLTTGHRERSLNEVYAAGHFGHAVLDLQPGIDFEKKEVVVLNEAFEGSKALVGHLREMGSYSFGEGVDLGRGVERNMPLKPLLSVYLGGAIACTKNNSLPPAVAKDLKFDMASMEDGGFDKIIVRESGFEVLTKRVCIVAQMNRLAATAGAFLEHEGKGQR